MLEFETLPKTDSNKESHFVDANPRLPSIHSVLRFLQIAMSPTASAFPRRFAERAAAAHPSAELDAERAAATRPFAVRAPPASLPDPATPPEELRGRRWSAR